MDRRKFLKVLGGGTVLTAAAVAGCDSAVTNPAEGFTPGEVPTDKMTYRTDSHGQKVSLLGYGQMRLPVIEVKGVDKGEWELDQESINQLTDYALAHGVNLFDTAPRYCKARSECAIGIALSRHRREEFLISTKLTNLSCDMWSFEASKKMYDESFERLQVDYIDYYMMHCMGLPGKDPQGNEVSPLDMFQRRFIDNGMLDFLIAEREKGRIRNLGFSYHGDVAVFDKLLSMHDQIHWDHVLIQHNYLNWQHAGEVCGDANSEYLYAELEKRDIPIMVMEPLLGGRLAELPEFAVNELKSRDPQASIASWAFRFAANQPRILTVLSGMTYMEHLQDNIRTYAPFQPLSDDELSALKHIADQYVRYPLVPCTSCQYCMPCPYGIDIPGTFIHYNKCVNDDLLLDEQDNLSESDERKAYRKARKAFLATYNDAMQRERQADHCIACGKCLSECPQRINIPEQMARISDYMDKLKTIV